MKSSAATKGKLIPYRLVIKDVNGDRENYTKARLKQWRGALAKALGQDAASMRNTPGSQKGVGPVIDESFVFGELEALPGLTPQRLRAMKARAARLQETVALTSALLPREKLVEERVGFFAVGAGMRGIGVLRKTSRAELYFLDLRSEPDREGSASARLPPRLRKAAMVALQYAAPSNETILQYGKKAVQIGEALSAAVPMPYKAGAAAVCKALGFYLDYADDRAKSDTDILVERIAEVIEKKVWELNVRQTVTEQSGKLTAVIRGFVHTYAPRQSDGVPKEELNTKYLEPYEKDLNQLTAILMQEAFCEAGLATFAIAAQTHLQVLRELALNDVRHTDNPLASPYCEQIKTYWAPLYIAHARKIFKKMGDDAVQLCESTTAQPYYGAKFRCMFTAPKEPLPTGVGWFYDNAYFNHYPCGYDGGLGYNLPWAHETCTKARNGYVEGKQASVTKTITNNLGFTQALANGPWTALLTAPLRLQ